MATKLHHSQKRGLEKYKYEVSQEIGRFSSGLKITPKNIKNNFKTPKKEG